MKDNFNRALDFVLKWEGGFNCDIYDPGGETKYGISKKSHPDLDIESLTLDQAKEIYRKEYWDNVNGDAMEWPFDLILFDTAVNMGYKRAMILYQENRDWKEYLFKRIQFYTKISYKTNDRFLKGWVNRVIDLYTTVKSSQGGIYG